MINLYLVFSAAFAFVMVGFLYLAWQFYRGQTLIEVLEIELTEALWENDELRQKLTDTKLNNTSGKTLAQIHP